MQDQSGRRGQAAVPRMMAGCGGVRRDPGVLLALHPDRSGPSREPGTPGRSSRLQGHRGDVGHLDHRTAPARPGCQQLPAAARSLPGQLHLRSALPRPAGEALRSHGCPGLANHRDPVTTSHLPRGKPWMDGPAPRRFRREGGSDMTSPGEGGQLTFARDIRRLS